MRRSLFIILILVIAESSQGQKGDHNGFGNTYIYTETEGIDESNFYISGIAKDGRVFFHAHTGSLFVKGNNYTRKIRFPAAAIPSHIEIIEIGDNKFIARGKNYYYIINNDSLIKWKMIPDGFDMTEYKNNVIGFFQNKIYLLENDSFVLKYSSPHLNNCELYFYTDSLSNIWEVCINTEKTDFYKLTDLSETAYQYSIPTASLEIDCGNFLRVKFPLRLDLIALNSPGLNPFMVTPVKLPTNRQIYYIESRENEYATLVNKNAGKKSLIQTPALIMGQDIYDTATFSFYFGTYKKPFRYFPYLVKHPHLFNKSNSQAIQAIAQDSMGRIWIHSYDGALRVLNSANALEAYDKELKFLNGSIATASHVYVGSEKPGYRFIQYDLFGRKKGFISNNMHVYFTGLSHNRQNVYLGTGPFRGIYITSRKSLDSGRPKWKIVDTKTGLNLQSIVSITEDMKGRIWASHPLTGFAVYDPKSNVAKTWTIAKGETEFGFWSSTIDTKGTIWFGTNQKGLMYFNNYRDTIIKPSDVKQIKHPLIPDDVKIMQMVQWGKWLVMGTGRDILLMDIEEWHRSRKVLIRYLNPQESNFSAPPEQNTILVDKRDSSIWFATSDMLYHWDIKNWLSLKTFEVKPNILLQSNKVFPVLTENHITRFDAGNNTLKFSIWFQSYDNMPRYLSVALVKEGEIPVFETPSLRTQFDYYNLAPGNYTLTIQICQENGYLSLHRFPIIISKFWWQKWWVWFALFMALFIPILMWIITRNRAKLAKEEAKRKAAELESTKSEYQKNLSELQIVSLSNQFRPHFILNALNTVGAELDNKPQAESVLSRLGESIDLIFNHTHKQTITHSFINEWRLVSNIIDIHRLMYLKNLETDLPTHEKIDGFRDIQIPLGLLQIPVENALLHGLSNREISPWKLKIEIKESEKMIIVEISDNGVGRAKASTLSNFRKHGTGIKNISRILEILNEGKTEKITIVYEDGIYAEKNEIYGTKSIITIPITFYYET